MGSSPPSLLAATSARAFVRLLSAVRFEVHSIYIRALQDIVDQVRRIPVFIMLSELVSFSLHVR